MRCNRQKIPPSFSLITRGDTTFVIKKGYEGTLLSADCDTAPPPDGTVRNSAGALDVKFGRGRYVSITSAKNVGERLIVRNYRHGGLLGGLLGRILFDRNRPINELAVTETALQKGVPCAEVIAVTIRRLWGIFFQADFISREITGAVDIIQFLKDSPSGVVRKSKNSVIYALAKTVRKMHDAGIYHADLHLKNLLVKKTPAGEYAGYVIDLDKSSLHGALTLDRRMKNLLRLDRSTEKFRLTHNIRLITMTDRVRFLRSYLAQGDAPGGDWKRCARKFRAKYAFHKFWWFVTGVSQRNLSW